MRVLLRASISVEAGNQSIKQGQIAKTIQAILDDQKPEAAYFVAVDGKRTAFLVLDIQDASEIPAIAEPWFLAFNARLTITPAMSPEDLAAAGSGIKQAAKKYGKTSKA